MSDPYNYIDDRGHMVMKIRLQKRMSKNNTPYFRWWDGKKGYSIVAFPPHRDNPDSLSVILTIEDPKFANGILDRMGAPQSTGGAIDDTPEEWPGGADDNIPFDGDSSEGDGDSSWDTDDDSGVW